MSVGTDTSPSRIARMDGETTFTAIAIGFDASRGRETWKVRYDGTVEDRFRNIWSPAEIDESTIADVRDRSGDPIDSDGPVFALTSGIAATNPVLAQGLDDRSEAVFRFAVPCSSGATRWYVAVASGVLARNVHASITKGDRVAIAGRLTTSGEGSKAIEVFHCAHDLNHGVSTWKRVERTGE